MLNKTPPYFLISKKKIFENLKTLKDLGLEVSYSWKTNPTIGSILNEKNSCDFSIHSLCELNQVKNKKNIWFFGLALNFLELDILTKKNNIKNFVIDNIQDLKILLSYIKKNNLKISLLLRMKLKENTIFTGRHYVLE